MIIFTIFSNWQMQVKVCVVVFPVFTACICCFVLHGELSTKSRIFSLSLSLDIWYLPLSFSIAIKPIPNMSRSISNQNHISLHRTAHCCEIFRGNSSQQIQNYSKFQNCTSEPECVSLNSDIIRPTTKSVDQFWLSFNRIGKANTNKICVIVYWIAPYSLKFELH